MSLEALDGSGLLEAWRAGTFRLVGQSERINRINVFPVADGDTGTNLSITATAVLEAIERAPSQHAGELLARMADAAIDGSRGNSGAILAQFLLGAADRTAELASLSAAQFAAAVEAGAAHARTALSDPREGTLLTLLRHFGSELAALCVGGERDVRALLTRSLPPLRAALDRTRTQLPELREANVVDAGALAFVELVEGAARYLSSGEIDAAPPPALPGSAEPAHRLGHADHRYCTECVLSGAAIDLRRLRETLSPLGSSLVLAGTSRKARLHLHTDSPEALFEAAAGFGTVSLRKADDILRQEAAAHHARGRRVAVVTDSAADLADEAMEALELHVVPVRVNFGIRSYLDRVTLSPAEFYRELARSAEPPRTSQPPPGDFRRMYEFLVSHYEAVVSVCLSSRVSGTCAAARTAAARISGSRVTVVDSANASLGQGLLAMYAAECAAAGWSAQEVVAATQRMIPRTRTFALLPGLEHAVRGGRVPAIFAPLSRWLRLGIVLGNKSDGRVSVVGALVGRRNRRTRFARFVRSRMRAGLRYRIAVGHADAPQEGERLLAELSAAGERIESARLAELGTALGAHGGPGLLVVGFQEYEAPTSRRAPLADAPPPSPRNPPAGARGA